MLQMRSDRSLLAAQLGILEVPPTPGMKRRNQRVTSFEDSPVMRKIAGKGPVPTSWCGLHRGAGLLARPDDAL